MPAKIEVNPTARSLRPTERLIAPLHVLPPVVLLENGGASNRGRRCKAESKTTQSPAQTCELLRNEIAHGQEYLAQVRRELSDQRELLEQWSQYEAACSLQPLDHLVQSAALKEAVEQFLIGWLNRRQRQLTAVSRQLHPTLRARRKGRQRKHAHRSTAKGSG
jgi:hypothetical protein